MGQLFLHQLTIIMMKVFAIVFGLLFVVGLVSCGPNGKTGPCFQTCEEDSDCNDPKPGGCNVCKTYTYNFMDKDVTFNRCSLQLPQALGLSPSVVTFASLMRTVPTPSLEDAVSVELKWRRDWVDWNTLSKDAAVRPEEKPEVDGSV